MGEWLLPRVGQVEIEGLLGFMPYMVWSSVSCNCVCVCVCVLL